jgi:hypothetical protein
MWFSPSTTLLRRVVADQGRLDYERGPGNRSELAPAGDGRFSIMTTPLTAVFSRRTDSLRLEQDGVTTQVFTRVKPPIKSLSAYAGTYRSAELGTTWTVAARDSSLMLHRENGDSVRVSALFADGFDGVYFVRFLRGNGGRITAMEVSAGDRARNLRFERMNCSCSRSTARNTATPCFCR